MRILKVSTLELHRNCKPCVKASSFLDSSHVSFNSPECSRPFPISYYSYCAYSEKHHHYLLCLSKNWVFWALFLSKGSSKRFALLQPESFIVSLVKEIATSPTTVPLTVTEIVSFDPLLTTTSTIFYFRVVGSERSGEKISIGIPVFPSRRCNVNFSPNPPIEELRVFLRRLSLQNLYHRRYR